MGLFLRLGGAAVHELLEEEHEAAQIDNQRGDKVGNLGGVQGLVQVRAAAGDVLNEIGGENGADGVEAPQEGGGNAVEAHGGNRGLGTLPLLEAGEEEQPRAQARQTSGNDHGQNDVPALLHAAVPGGALVEAGGLELIAQLGLFQKHPDENSRQNR